MSLSVRSTKWRVEGNELTKTYEFSGLPPPDTTAKLGIDCSLNSSLLGIGIDTIVHLFFRPFRLPGEAHFVMGLVTPDYDGGMVPVVACPVQNDPDTALINVGLTGGREAVSKCVNALSSGKELAFMLLDGSKPLVKLPLPNDREFGQLYENLYKSIARSQDAQAAIFDDPPENIAGNERSPANEPAQLSQCSAGDEQNALDGRLVAYQRFLGDLRKVAAGVVSVGNNKWEHNGTAICRNYYLMSGAGKNSRSTLRVKLSGTSTGRSANFRLQPFHLLRQHVFPVRISTQDREIGYQVNLTATSPEYGCADFTSKSDDDVGKCINIFCAGKDITLGIIDAENEIATLFLPNDASFANLYGTMRQEISRSQPTRIEAEKGTKMRAQKDELDEQLDRMLDSAEWSAERLTQPFHPDLYKQAEANVGPHDPSAIMDEYNRLLYLRLHQRQRSLWSRLFG